MSLLHLLGVRPVEVGEGRSRVELVVSDQHLRTLGIAHGGLVATLLDTALGWAAGSKAPDGLDVVTAQLNINFIRPARPGEVLIAWGEVQHAGRRTAVARGEIQTADGALVATGSATFMYVRIEPA
jgi:uncharacterized protein (TIGR00369 family)